MKILLVYPPVKRMQGPPYMKTLQAGLGHLPPIGLMYLAGHIKAKTGHSVEILDAPVLGLSHPEIREAIRKTAPDVVGIYCVTLNLPDVLLIARTAGEISAGIRVVLGGPHAAIFPAETLAFPEVDYIIPGEAEIVLGHFLDYLEKGGRAALPEGVYGKENGVPYPFPGPAYHRDLDALAFPDRVSTPFEKYVSVVSLHPPLTVMVTSWGCPFSCSFCNTAGGKKFRPRSPENILSEIKECLKLGIREFSFFDEVFTLDRKRVLALCEAICRENLSVFWDARCRVDLVDEEMLIAMKKAGCVRIQYGVESGDNRILGIMKKGITTEQALTAFRLTRKAGISTYADFMIGNPGETGKEIETTTAFARELNPDYVHFSVTLPLPRTPLYEDALRDGVIKTDYWAAFAKNPTTDFTPPYWEESFSSGELEDMVKSAYKQFYLSPRFIARSIMRLTSPGELARKAKAGLHLLFRF